MAESVEAGVDGAQRSKASRFTLVDQAAEAAREAAVSAFIMIPPPPTPLTPRQRSEEPGTSSIMFHTNRCSRAGSERRGGLVLGFVLPK